MSKTTKKNIPSNQNMNEDSTESISKEIPKKISKKNSKTAEASEKNTPKINKNASQQITKQPAKTSKISKASQKSDPTNIISENTSQLTDAEYSVLDQNALNGCILIAMPDLDGSVFSQSVVFICDHAEHGSLGVVLNKAINLTLGDLFDKLELPHKKTAKYLKQPILLGGPVESDKGFVVHPNQDRKFLSNVERDLTITTSMDILEHLAQKTGPQKFVIALGCAMWESGQLMDEIRKNRWLVWHLSKNQQEKVSQLEDFVFNIDVSKKYNTALKNLGLEPWQLSMFGGNG
jgi:putative transcriptional regulator